MEMPKLSQNNTRNLPGFAPAARWSQAMLGLMLAASLAGCGSEENQTTLYSPVQAVTTLLEKADGTVDAELVLISTSVRPNVFIDSATNARVRVPTGESVSLDLTSSGHYTASSEEDENLIYQAGSTYQFSFDLEDELASQVSGGNFVAVMTAPDYEPTFEFSDLVEFAGDSSEISWTPSDAYGLIKIYDADENLVYANFDFSDPSFNGSKWARLTKGSKSLGVDVFADPGTYTIEFCAVDKVSDFSQDLSAELGALSGFLIGRCAEPQTLDVID